jgi:Fe-S-cluster-containing dehydrogenase component
MIHIEYVERSTSVQTVPVVCMHCHSPTCADVCPADAIKRSGDGRVMTARKPRCIACSNCVLACPFGVPKMMTEFDLMMKCDMCFDRTSTGRKPMCATVCPSEALFFGTREEVEIRRRRSRPINEFRFGGQVVATKVNMMVPLGRPAASLDVTAAMHERPAGGLISLNVLTDEPVPVEDAS